MPTAAVTYLSATYTTASLADSIGEHLRARGIETTVASIEDVDPATLGGVDYLLLGAWTHGWFVIGQHPDAPWVEWANGLPRLAGVRVGLFTTYRLRTGSMFPRMRRALAGKDADVSLELQARGSALTDEARAALDRFIGRPQGA